MNGPVQRWEGIDTDPRFSRIFSTNPSAQGLTLDATRDRLYVNAGSTGVLVVDAASTTSGTEVTSIAIQSAGGGRGAISYDPARERLYVAGSDQVFIIDRVNELAANATATALAVDLPQAAEVSAFAFP